MTDREARQTNAWLLLTARAAQWEWMPADHEGLTQSEVAGMLAGLERRAYYSGLLCLAERWDCLRTTRRLLCDYALELSIVEEWNLTRGPRPVFDLVHLALLEMTGPSMPCPICGGSGSLERPGSARRSCEQCEGSGRIPRTQRSRAELVGVHEGNWRRIWRDRYRGVYGELQNWVSDASSHLARALSARRRVSA